nr:MATE family efflux transporter [Clostridia bacterium]
MTKTKINFQDTISKYLGTRQFWKTALALGLPIAFQNLLMSSFTLVDTLMVGQLGDISLSAVGMAGQWSWLMGLVLFGMNSGSSVFISQYWGASDKKSIKNVYGIMVLNTVAVGILFMILGLAIPERIIMMFNKTPEVVSEGAAYLRIAAFSYIGIALNNSFSTLLRSTENVKLPMYASAVSTVFNAGLNYSFIFGIEAIGIPAMGVRGAALATVISSWISPAVVLLISLKQKNIMIMKPSEFFGFSKQLFVRFYKISAPVIFNESLWGLGTVIYNMIYGQLGYENYAAVTIHKTVEGICFVFFVGLCNACCVMVGKSIGAGDNETAKADGRRFMVIVPLVSFAVGMIFISLRPGIIYLFNIQGGLTEQTISSAMGIMMIYGLWICFRNVPYISIVGIFRAGGDTLTGMKYDLLCQWCLSIPLTFISAFVLDLPFTVVFFIAYAAEDVIKVFLCIRRFASYKWIMPLTSSNNTQTE